MSASSLELLKTVRDATGRVFFSFVHQRLVAASYKWFNWYGTANLSNALNHFIAKIHHDPISMAMLGSTSKHQHPQLNISLHGKDAMNIFQTEKI